MIGLHFIFALCSSIGIGTYHGSFWLGFGVFFALMSIAYFIEEVR